MSAKAYLSISPEVKKALAEGKPVVALESTIITHGMPYPQNLSMAQNVEAVIRQHGAVPATIAIMDGRFCVGVSGEDLERLALEGGKAAKASRRDAPRQCHRWQRHKCLLGRRSAWWWRRWCRRSRP